MQLIPEKTEILKTTLKILIYNDGNTEKSLVNFSFGKKKLLIKSATDYV